MTKKTRTEDWYTLEWKDEAGREQSMTGPHYALEDQTKALDKAGTEYSLDKIGHVESAEPI